MRKKKIYLDTSVISHLDAEDAPEKMETTLKLWDILQNDDEYETYISYLAYEEIDACSEPKRTFMINKLNQIHYKELSKNKDIESLVNAYVDNSILSEKSIDDLTHIAIAVLNDVDYILSWNFKHFVNVKTIKEINLVNSSLNYKIVEIIPPFMIVGGED